MHLSPLERVRTTLAAALHLPEQERLAFVHRQCGDDPEVCAEIEALLAVHDSAAGFLDTPLPELLGASLPPANKLPPGMLLANRYRIQSLLSSTGFATVYLAQDEHIVQRPVVVKVLDQITSDHLLQRVFQAEMQSLGRLQHPNIVTLSDRGELPNGTPFLVLSYVPGQTLRQVLHTCGPLPRYRVQTIIRGVAQALAAAHALSVWHLDIKPENIILTDAETSNERVTVIDFGIARMRELPGSGVRAGSPQYMAPEQGVMPSAESDIYSLAIVTFELLTGRLPDRKKPLRAQLPPNCAAWADILEKALATDPRHRPQSAVAFSKALREPDQPGRHRWFAAAAALPLLAAAGTALYYWTSQQPDPQFEPVPLVTNPGFKQRPSFSPDGRELFYIGGSPDRWQIFRKPLDGATATVVTSTPFKDVMAQVSPAGNRMSIIRETPTGRVVLVRSMDPAGLETEILAGREFASAAWTGDGQHLLVAERSLARGMTRIGLVHIASRRWRVLLEPVEGSAGDHFPTVSPSGQWLAFARDWEHRQTDLMRVPIRPSGDLAGQPQIVVTGRNHIQSVQWTPDGKELVFVDGPVGAGSLWRVQATGATPRPILAGAGEIESVSVPLRAWRLAYAVQNSDINVWQYHLKTRESRPLVAGAYVDNEASLSPNGKILAFFSSRTGSEQLYLAAPDGSNPRLVTHFEKPDALHLIWSADSNHLIISVRSAALGQRIYRAPAAAPERLTELRRDAFATALSADGRSLYFRSAASGQWEIWRLPYPSGGTPQQLTFIGGYTAKESTDGRKLFFAKRHERDGLWEQELPAGTARQVVDRLYRRSLFAPGREGLYWVAPGAESGEKQALYYWDFRRNTRTKVHTFDRQVFWGFELTPDGQSLLYSQYDVGNSHIMLVPNFR